MDYCRDFWTKKVFCNQSWFKKNYLQSIFSKIRNKKLLVVANGKFRFYFIIINTYFILIIMIICIFVYNNRINILLLMIKNNFHSYTQIEIWKFDVHHTWSKSLYIPIYLLTIHVYFQNVLYSNQIIFLGYFSKTKCSCSRV